MPELPEVEVVKRSLERNILNLIIKKVKINDANLRYKVDKIELNYSGSSFVELPNFTVQSNPFYSLYMTFIFSFVLNT